MEINNSIPRTQNATTSKQNTVRNIFLSLLEKAQPSPEKHLNELSDFLNNLYHKKCLKSQITPQKAGAFNAIWDGALVIINAYETPAELQAQNSDLDLLKNDLSKLANLF